MTMYPEDVYGDAQARERLAVARSRMWATLSGGKNTADPNTSTEVEYRPIADLIRLNAAKSEMRSLLAGGQGSGASDTTKDSGDTNTENGTPYAGNWQITSRGRSYADLLQAEKSKLNTPSPSPAVSGNGDWSPNQHQTAYSASNKPFDPDKAADDLLRLHTRHDGSIEQNAKKYFLSVTKDGSQPEHFENAVPLAVVNPISAQPEYHPDAVDAAYKLVDGSINGIVDRKQQTRLIRLKKRNHIPLNSDQKDYIMRHNGAAIGAFDEDI
jgi:hypothetical protein